MFGVIDVNINHNDIQTNFHKHWILNDLLQIMKYKE